MSQRANPLSPSISSRASSAPHHISGVPAASPARAASRSLAAPAPAVPHHAAPGKTSEKRCRHHPNNHYPSKREGGSGKGGPRSVNHYHSTVTNNHYHGYAH
ncbi:uncharacterized protein LDX57_007427 [Aspergillus melleus]|uniref:uncharacterized protein n=1 Tax=Aspergillus melleus TaxID=138277 RepID=UPI001E8E974E|nr:uncharacterized protein LDX57_007427 [Aspergillus melleus]KAH8429755.1 hypothetical protein LDX57_007427 [Aspergillus melleus]